ncbi:DUF3618 domain-containing protein [Actinomadura bangladeshensis]|uniref:DUF3618 domain-containing protein n=1 Tax=Actinomadura bangladeshensis TaxID=453573 RepID=A0A6L9QGQ6_9ACTN|nr:DUF3618 domain-containing protein [Actinomadura bangladeshensis]NEA24650.1 DUF3618 domain-containing protein [Actinomadura bangladeshensis]
MADWSSDPEELERHIERSRRELARAVDELADRLSPRNVAHRGVERVKEEADQVVKAFGALVRPSDDDEDGQGVDKRVVLAGVGAAVTVAALVLWRRRRKRR